GQSAALPVTVLSVSAAGDPATHRFEVRASLPERQGLRSGLFARLLVPMASTDARLSVPAAALVRRGGLAGVFVVADARARLRWVAVGAPRGERIEVRAGVGAGEEVVIDPGVLEDGALVSASASGVR
ncbi:MAG TPA: efflux RND transporter periplasmic adaptor subunit, partial [Vicinamibacteria bacterium]|nr:efflux RND transporter periplasmic adaptor subunit [Vicinamibacteria bacterium]